MSMQMQQLRTKRSKRANRRGGIVVLAAMCLVIVFVFLAFTIDYGYIVVAESELQNAADVGALSGARALHDDDGREAAVAAAIKWVGLNTVAGQNVILDAEEDIEIGSWDDETATFTVVPENSSVVPDAVKVTCRRDSDRGNPLQLFFGPILGTKYASRTLSSVAQNKGGSCGGIMALEKVYLNDRQANRASYTDSYNSNKGEYNSNAAGKNGDICTNGHLTLNGNSRVNGDARWWEEANDPNANESQVTGDFESFEDPIDFPDIDPGDAATINDNHKLLLSDNGVPLFSDGKFQLGSIIEGGDEGGKKKKKGGSGSGGSSGSSSGTPDSVTLPPGTYYFSEMTVGSNSTITVTGPTYIYVEGQVDLRWGGINNTTKKPINLQMYPMGADTYFYLPFFGELHASIYSTKAHIYLDEKDEPISLDFYGKMVGQKIRVWDTGLHIDESLTFGALESGGEQIGKTGVSLVQ